MSLHDFNARHKGTIALDGSLLRLKHIDRFAVANILDLFLGLIRQVTDGQLFRRWALNFCCKISPSLSVEILVNIAVTITRFQDFRLQVENIISLVCHADVLEVLEFELALFIELLLPRHLGLLHLCHEISLNTLLLLDSLVLVHSILRLAELDALRQVQVDHHIILHLGNVRAARLLLLLLLVALLKLELGLRLGQHAAIKLTMRMLDGMVEVGNEASFLSQLLLVHAVLVINLMRQLLLRVVLVEAFH